MFMIFYFFLMMGLEAFAVVSYIFSAKSLYAIAQRRGFRKPWLAWIPVGSSWLLGAISDQYRHVVHGQTRNRRKLLMLLTGGLMVVALLLLTLCMIWAISILVALVAEEMEVMVAIYVIGFFLIWLMCYGLIAAAAVVSIFEHMAYFDLYRSCDPDKSLLFLLIGIFTSCPVPFFLYSCKDKDLGMIPKQAQAPAEQSDEQQEEDV
jgi:hypothetical protein